MLVMGSPNGKVAGALVAEGRCCRKMLLNDREVAGERQMSRGLRRWVRQQVVLLIGGSRWRDDCTVAV